jgi:2-dehydrotetronate isomerase
MPRFAANLSMMFPEYEEPQRFEAARKAGFTACEFLRPYNHAIADVRRWLDDAGMELVLLNSPMGNQDAGERGLGALPGRQEDFRASLDQALDYANGLGAGMVHLMAGVVPEGVLREECEQTFIENVAGASETAKKRGVRLMLEPLNARDVPGYLHSTSAQARRIIEASGADNVFLQYDFYHLQIMQGDLVEGLKRDMDIIGHIQFSSVPGRHEPQHGEVNMPHCFEAVDSLGFTGWVGCEYRPKAGTVEGLTWAHQYGIGLAEP